jgi:protein-S-isoprenylcysteine O-methyltransferase Ste14
MCATNWEFENRAAVFGMIFGFSFPLYALDHQNAVASLANILAPKISADPDQLAREIFFAAAALLTLAVLIRVWASAYLQAEIVYAKEVKSEALVADGPYRRVRNPLYFANVLMAIGMGSMMSRAGFALAVVAMTGFCYRLIFREESELRASQGESYEKYLKAVPRLWPSPWPRVPSSGRAAHWSAGFKAESWYWGFPLSVLGFAITLKLWVFFVVFGAGLALFWIITSSLQKKAASR